MSFGNMALVIFLLVFCVCSFVSALPAWVAGFFAGLAGILLLTGK